MGLRGPISRKIAGSVKPNRSAVYPTGTPRCPEWLSKSAKVEWRRIVPEMEAAGLYTLAAFHGRRALAICTVSDHLVTHEETTAQEREQTFRDMIEIALRAATA